MTLSKAIHKLRTDANLSQEQFAQLFDVSQQSVQKWEKNESVPELSKIVKISKYFGVSLDALILGNDIRAAEERRGTEQIKPQYSLLSDWEFCASRATQEYRQSVEEGLDLETYQDLFRAVSKLPKDEIKDKLGDVLFEIVSNAKQKEGYPYLEPNDWEGIRALTKPYIHQKKPTASLSDKISGAWMGRIAGCMLGKTVECIRTDELIPFLKESNNYPMWRYILKSDLPEDVLTRYRYNFSGRAYVDTIDGMPPDDDVNYMVLYQIIIEKYGRDFTPLDVSRAWLRYQPKDAYCTAEQVAFCNFVKGYVPPLSARYKNPYREWIGAQIRGDYFGYINPGDPQTAAEMAWRDASISHVKNGIYGEMLVSAMLAVAAETNDRKEILLGGLAQIPTTSRLYEKLMSVLEGYEKGVTQEECMKSIHEQFNEHVEHDWCHTISNAMIVTAALLYGEGDYARSICMAVETGFDTDCNGATVGSLLGMANGLESIPEYWTKPFGDILRTSVFGHNRLKISDRIQMTLDHIEKREK